VERTGNVTVLTFTGSVERDVENMLAKDLKGNILGVEGSHLLLDFTHVTYINSVELGTLITLHKRMVAVGGRLTLFNLADHVYEVFQLTRLDSLLGICREEPDLVPGQA